MPHRHPLLPTVFAVLMPALAPAAPGPEPAAPPGGRASAAPRMARLAHVQDERSGPETTETITRTFTLGPGGSFDIFSMAGQVVVTGGPGQDVVLTAVKRVRGRPADAEAQLASTMIDAKELAGRLEVRTVSKRTKNMHTWVDYSVVVPYATSVSARVLSGDVRIEKVKGDVQVESANGTIEAIGTPRLVRVKTLSGDILLTDAASNGALSASTMSGQIVMKGVKARSLELATISGDVTLADTSCDRAQVRTVNGALDFGGALVKGGRYEFTSHSGDVRLKLGGSAGFELAAQTFSGDVRSDLALVLDPGDPNLPPGVPQRRDVRGMFGDGGALVLVKTFSGSVVVARADGAKPGPKPAPGKKQPQN